MSTKGNAPQHGGTAGRYEHDGLGTDDTRPGAGKPTAADMFATPDDLGPSRADALTKLLASVPTTNDADLTTYLRELTAHGLAVLFVAPGQKAPVDMRSPKERREADEAAQDAAKAAGRSDWTHAKAPAGVHLASSDPEVLARYLAKYRTAYGDVPVNLAVAVGPSRLVIVDADTASQVDAFLTDAGMVGEPPTVRSPGAKNAEGEWMHSNGGHYWFALEDGDELPADGTGSVTAKGDYAVLWRDRYVLIPPSMRPEGAYTVTGRVHTLPEPVRGTITAAVTTRLEARERASVPGALADDIDAWAESVPWSEILEPHGWTLAARPDRCGCDTWTAPGEHASPKSATTHETGCTLGTYSVVNAPMHIWTDNPGDELEAWISERGSKTLSKLQTVAALYFDGDVGAVMTAQDLTGEPYAMNAPEGEAEGKADEEDAHLPESFWSAHSVLGHIRQVAHYGGLPADALLGTILGRLSAHVDPSIRVTTGARNPLPLNMFVGLVGWTGSGKTSSDEAAETLVEFVPSSTDPLELIAPNEVPETEPLGSGPGLAEAFMRTIPDPKDLAGKKTIRVQGAHKLFVSCDEGAALARNITDDRVGHGLGRTLREAWSGRMIGQGGVGDRKRKVTDYSLGLVVGLQLPALADLSTTTELDLGTPQRFLWLAATDPSIPDEQPENPGKLSVQLPARGFHYEKSLAAEVRKASLARTRVRLDDLPDLVDTVNPLESQREAMIARVAVLLVILCSPGRYEITRADRELATVVYEASLRAHKVAMRFKAERDAREASSRTRARIAEAVGVAAATQDAGAVLERLGDRIKGYLAKAPGKTMTWGGRDGIRKKFKSDERVLAEQARDGLASRELISYDAASDAVTLLM